MEICGIVTPLHFPTGSAVLLAWPFNATPLDEPTEESELSIEHRAALLHRAIAKGLDLPASENNPDRETRQRRRNTVKDDCTLARALEILQNHYNASLVVVHPAALAEERAYAVVAEEAQRMLVSPSSSPPLQSVASEVWGAVATVKPLGPVNPVQALHVPVRATSGFNLDTETKDLSLLRVPVVRLPPLAANRIVATAYAALAVDLHKAALKTSSFHAEAEYGLASEQRAMSSSRSAERTLSEIYDFDVWIPSLCVTLSVAPHVARYWRDLLDVYESGDSEVGSTLREGAWPLSLKARKKAQVALKAAHGSFDENSLGEFYRQLDSREMPESRFFVGVPPGTDGPASADRARLLEASWLQHERRVAGDESNVENEMSKIPHEESKKRKKRRHRGGLSGEL